MEIALLLLLFGGSWAQEVDPRSKIATFISLENFSHVPQTLHYNSMTFNPMAISSTRDQISTSPSSTTLIAHEEMPFLETSVDTNTGSPATESTTSQEASINDLPTLLETSNAASDPTVPVTVDSLRSHTGFPETITSSLETSYATDRPFITMETISLTASDVTSGPLTTIAMETSSLKASDVTSKPLITMETSSLKTSDVTSRPPVKKTTQSQESSSTTISTTTISETSTHTTTKFSSQSDEEESDNTLLVAVLVALLVVVVLVALLLLWRRRQKKRTGALMLRGGGKRDRVVDAWAGPTLVPDEEPVVIVGGSGVDKDTPVPDGEGSGRRPSLTTFFGKRKSRQDSLTLETLEAGSVPSPKGEEEPLMSSEGGTVEAPTSDGPKVSNGNASGSL